ncbi:MAG: DUF2061 domain-containing protein [Saprospiraceae bacterium]
MVQNSLGKESRLRSILKGFSWRGVAMLDTFFVAIIVTWIIYGEPQIEKSFWIMLIETPLKLVIYYVHERMWQRFWRAKEIHNKDLIKKTVSWRIIATLMTFSISGSILGKDAAIAATAIAITELVSKTILYYFHEKTWLKVNRGNVRKAFRKIKSKFS